MIAPRRLLPSMSSLLALEAVARLGTATAAAAELALTHSAISRQLKVLEAQIGTTLFRREGKALILTAAGQVYVDTIRSYLQDLARASQRLRAAGQQRVINLAVLPAFAQHWLLPRLKAFTLANPGVTLNFTTRLAPFDFDRERLDAALHYGDQNWPGVIYQQLAREEVIPMAAPDLAARLRQFGPYAPGHLLHLPLLHLESRPGAWDDWFLHQGIATQPLTGALFDQFAHLAEAAALGLGVALLPRFLASAATFGDRLCPLAPEYLPLGGQYYMVRPKAHAPSKALLRLAQHLAESDPG